MVARKIKRVPSTEDLDANVAEYLLNRSTRERSEFHEGRYKRDFLELLAVAGEHQDGGHRVLYLNEPVLFHSYKAGKAQEKEISGIRRVRRESTTLNADRVMVYLAQHGLTERCTVAEPQINEDALLAANFDGTISDEDLAKLYDKSETFAFYLVEGTED